MVLCERKSILETSIINIFEFIVAFLYLNQSGDLIYEDTFCAFTLLNLILKLPTNLKLNLFFFFFFSANRCHYIPLRMVS